MGKFGGIFEREAIVGNQSKGGVGSTFVFSAEVAVAASLTVASSLAARMRSWRQPSVKVWNSTEGWSAISSSTQASERKRKENGTERIRI